MCVVERPDHHCGNYLVLQGSCLIEGLSWGYEDQTTLNGFISFNSRRVFTSNKIVDHRGIHLVELDPGRCVSTSWRRFDTWNNRHDADTMATYVDGLLYGTVVVGVTVDEPCHGMTTLAFQSLQHILGVDLVFRCPFRGKFVFVAVVGQPQGSLVKIGGSGGDNVHIRTTYPLRG